MAVKKGKKREFECISGPFAGSTIYLESPCTMMFKLGLYHGKYVPCEEADMVVWRSE